jgi:hypothetical protein
MTQITDNNYSIVWLPQNNAWRVFHVGTLRMSVPFTDFDFANLTDALAHYNAARSIRIG